MTCIVGLEDDGDIYLGGDSAGVDENFDLMILTEPKVFAKDDMVFGFVDSLRMGQVLQYCLSIPERPSNKTDIEYLVSDFMNAVRDAYRDSGIMTKENEAEFGGFFLLGYNGKLYRVENNFQICRCATGYNAAGCGENYARGSMFTTQALTDPAKRITLALEAAAKHSAAVAPPFTIIKLPKGEK